ncbi:MAG: tRNA-splicing endonuclease [ANME-2 cluster archaeon HR1]|nr:MAG: tRNA-splicing endonuclease [ANME-2 cluster archaeon HR1]
MYGHLCGSTVHLGGGAREIIYDTGFFGRPKDDYLELTLIESVYLHYKGRITVELDGKDLDLEDLIYKSSRRMDNFEVKYIVYKDLRERGYYIKPGVTDFRVYPRGGRPGSTPSKYFVQALSERQILPLPQLIRQVETTDNLKKEMILAVVDEESDITFYSTKLRSMKGESKKISLNNDIRASLLEDRVIVWDIQETQNLHNELLYGKPLDEKRLHLSLIEAAYLQVNGLIIIRDSKKDVKNNILAPDIFAEQAAIVDPDFPLKLAVYKDLRDQGMVVKTGYKFGSHYRVYKKVNSKSKMKHSEFLVHAIDNDHIFNLPQLSRAVRLAHSVRKQMIFAWKAGNNIRYLEIGRIKM